MRRGRGHFPPSAPAARGRPGQASGSQGSAAGGEGSGREGRGGRGPAHYAKRPPPPPLPPRGKGKRPRSASAASMAAQARPPPRRGPAQRVCSYLRLWRHNSRGAGPVSAAGAPGTEGKTRSRAGAGGQEPGGARAAGTPRRVGAERGGGPGPGAAGVAEGPRFVIVFVSERSEFVTPVPLPPPPARWEEEGECSSSSSRRQPHRGGGGRASTRLAERARAPERRGYRRS